MGCLSTSRLLPSPDPADVRNPARHHPDSARHTIGEIIGEAERRLGILRKVSESSLSTAPSLDGELDEATLEEFLSRVLTPGH